MFIILRVAKRMVAVEAMVDPKPIAHPPVLRHMFPQRGVDEIRSRQAQARGILGQLMIAPLKGPVRRILEERYLFRRQIDWRLASVLPPENDPEIFEIQAPTAAHLADQPVLDIHQPRQSSGQMHSPGLLVVTQVTAFPDQTHDRHPIDGADRTRFGHDDRLSSTRDCLNSTSRNIQGISR
ncbi:hypothetical protein TA3x_001728 [Tundrisphaera sp. TA3]|uniref:hypothetical protein n=1 Tax=Tundrisphaera sp. TA3 TaxID=3435775 RepID=UPI003EBF289D